MSNVGLEERIQALHINYLDKHDFDFLKIIVSTSDHEKH